MPGRAALEEEARVDTGVDTWEFVMANPQDAIQTGQLMMLSREHRRVSRCRCEKCDPDYSRPVRGEVKGLVGATQTLTITPLEKDQSPPP